VTDWADAAANVLNAEEADEIAHALWRPRRRRTTVVVDLLLIGETVLAITPSPTVLDYRPQGAEREIAHLQESLVGARAVRVRDFALPM